MASARLAKLEKALGADLLRRSTRKVTLSLEGSEFLPYAREILARESAALAALGRGVAGATGTLHFAAPSTFAQPVTPGRSIRAEPAAGSSSTTGRASGWRRSRGPVSR